MPLYLSLQDEVGNLLSGKQLGAQKEVIWDSSYRRRKDLGKLWAPAGLNCKYLWAFSTVKGGSSWQGSEGKEWRSYVVNQKRRNEKNATLQLKLSLQVDDKPHIKFKMGIFELILLPHWSSSSCMVKKQMWQKNRMFQALGFEGPNRSGDLVLWSSEH